MTTAEDAAPSGWLFWASLLAGAALVGVGARGLVHDRIPSTSGDYWRWFAAAGIAHDALVAPAFVGVAWLTRRLPAAVRHPVRAGLAMSAVLTAIAWPLVQGWGRRAAVPSALPLDYGRNLVATLAALWVVVAVVVIVQVRRTRSTS